MRVMILLLRVVVLGITFALGMVGAFLGNLASPATNSRPCVESLTPNSSTETGVAFDRAPGGSTNSSPVQILSKPKAAYTDEALTNNIEGHVTLKITFMADGTVGAIKVVEGLPDGLTENAVEAAKQIKFAPKMINGQPVSTVMTFEYGFNIY